MSNMPTMTTEILVWNDDERRKLWSVSIKNVVETGNGKRHEQGSQGGEQIIISGVK